MKKILAVALAAIVMLGLVNIGAAEAPITVTFWNGWTGSDGDVLIEKVDEFNKTNPYNIHIEMDINADFQTKNAASFAADEGPAMSLGAHSYKDTYPDYLIDMNEVFEKTNLKREDFIQGYLDLCSKSYEEWAEWAAKINNPDMNIYGSGISYNAI